MNSLTGRMSAAVHGCQRQHQLAACLPGEGWHICYIFIFFHSQYTWHFVWEQTIWRTKQIPWTNLNEMLEWPSTVLQLWSSTTLNVAILNVSSFNSSADHAQSGTEHVWRPIKISTVIPDTESIGTQILESNLMDMMKFISEPKYSIGCLSVHTWYRTIFVCSQSFVRYNPTNNILMKFNKLGTFTNYVSKKERFQKCLLSNKVIIWKEKVTPHNVKTFLFRVLYVYSDQFMLTFCHRLIHGSTIIELLNCSHRSCLILISNFQGVEGVGYHWQQVPDMCTTLWLLVILGV